MKPLTPLLLLTLLTLGACAQISNPRFLVSAYKEPESGDRARLRTVTGGVVRLIPNRACHDEYAGGGIVANNAFTGLSDSHLNGQKLGMSGDATAKYQAVSEVYIPAGQPIDVSFMSQQGAGKQATAAVDTFVCNTDWTFVPEANKDYETRSYQDGKMCYLAVTTLEGILIGQPALKGPCPAP
ncbi:MULTISPECIES: hypothetical protein [Silvimonas]|uniref:hypothetical protein n=1 Tax=Silvimonas TaxID=300264 RepID=UPI0024B356EB|nr:MULTISPECIES: hypothetical protein [Silvimonas]MDR3427612.1 hypothetical protein [Silvimonas sp.]